MYATDLLATGLDVFDLFLIIAALNMLVVVRSAQLLPEIHTKTVAAIRGITG